MASEDYRRTQDSARSLRTLTERVEALERGASLRSAGIGGGGMHVNGGSVFVEQGGNVEVNDGGSMRVNDGGDVSINGGGRVKVFDNGGIDINGGSLNAYSPDGSRTVQLYGGTIFLRRLDTELFGHIHASVNPENPSSSSLVFKPPHMDANDPTRFYMAGRGTNGQGNVYVTADAASFETPDGSASILNIQGPSGGLIFLSATKQIAITTDKCFVSGDFTVTGTKNFEIPHPTKPGQKLLHGSTESPVSGLEYWGEAVLDDDGAAVVVLPEYFEALAAADSRAAFLTPIDEPVALAASRVSDGRFTVRGPAGASFTWLVKARRGDKAGQFNPEPPPTPDS